MAFLFAANFCPLAQQRLAKTGIKTNYKQFRNRLCKQVGFGLTSDTEVHHGHHRLAQHMNDMSIFTRICQK